MQRTRRTPLSETQQPEPAEPADAQEAGSGAPAPEDAVAPEDGPAREAEPAPEGEPAPEAEDAPAPPRTPLLFAAVAVLALVVDQVTKAIALRNLQPGDPVDLIGSLLRLHLVKNPGAAFSLGTGYTVVLTCVAVGVAAAVIHLSRRLRSKGWTIAFGLLLGGALGNLSDRFFREPAPLRGQVVDFLEFPHWPIFNLADTAIVTAACLMVLQTLRGIGLDGSREHRG
jgi:signal peptidase II